MSDELDENDITLTIIRTSDAKKMEIVLPLSTKLGELKEDLGTEELFGPMLPDHQRLFFLGRELKSKNRSLEKLGLDRYPKNRVLHLHVKTVSRTSSSSSSSSGIKRQQQQQQQQQRNNNSSRRQTRSSSQQKVTVTQTSAGDVLEIHDDSDDEIIIEDNSRDKRRRIS